MMKTERVQTDVLCIGGGIAGLMAAIRASELGAKVVVAEKGVTKYSGSARAGNDHFWCYIPEIHGPDVDLIIKESRITQKGPVMAMLGTAFLRTWLKKTLDIIKLWDEWGIPMRNNGRWELSGHAFPGRPVTHLKYRGFNQKPVLMEQALKRGAKIMDRTMVYDLLADEGGIRCAVGVDTREDTFVEFDAKSVILATGTIGRVYPNAVPELMGNNTRPFTLTGDGRAMAWRAGADLLNMEMINRHAGIKNYCRSGQGSWIGVCRDPSGAPVGKYVNKPERDYGDIIIEVDKSIFERYLQSGKGPIYMDCRGISEADHAYLMTGLEHEGNLGLLQHFKDEGIDLRKNPVEFMTYELRSSGMIRINEKGETTVKGLYAAGEESMFSISGASVFGWISGENAAHYAKAKNLRGGMGTEGHTESLKNQIEAIQTRSHGPDWKDANIALNHTLSDYAGLVRSESLLNAGLTHLRRLKQNVQQTMMARTRWELVRCIEVLNLFDLGELVFLAALDRKESRGLHHRADFPYTDPLLNDKLHVARKEGETTTIRWEDAPR